MADFRDNLYLLVVSLVSLVGLFLFASMLEDRRFVGQVFWAIVFVMVAIFVLARFGGGNLGKSV